MSEHFNYANPFLRRCACIPHCVNSLNILFIPSNWPGIFITKFRKTLIDQRFIRNILHP